VPLLKGLSLQDFGFVLNMGSEPLNDTEFGVMNATVWTRRQLLWWCAARLGRQSVEPYDAIDKFLILAYTRRKLSDSDSQPFVLAFWDLTPQNIVIGNDDKLVGYASPYFEAKIAISIVDWDMVVPVPLKLAARSIEETLFQWTENSVKFNSGQAQLFQSELTRIEKKRSSSDQISQLFLHSEEN
jgi:hypothetical protein